MIFQLETFIPNLTNRPFSSQKKLSRQHPLEIHILTTMDRTKGIGKAKSTPKAEDALKALQKAIV